MKNISLYIHIPFCKQKCMYCDFPSYSGKDALMEEYINALCKEIAREASKYSYNTVFIGGGTPSYLDEDNLEKLLKEINKLSLNRNLEFTMECNPGSLTKEKLDIMKSYGVNRLSLGLQSTKNSILKEIGRIHSFEEFKSNYSLAREMGFNNINVDTMFGLPNQSVEDFKNTLGEITELNPEHISAYSLIIEEETAFYKLWEEDKLKLPSEDEEREMYEYCVDYLNEKGYLQYEISNFSKKDKECRHNKVYWELEEYLGCGSSSASLIDGKRIKNTEDIKEYIEAINSNKSAKIEIINLKEEDLIEEFMFLGLRKKEGIDESIFKRKFNKELDSIYEKVIKFHINEGLLVREKGKIYLSKKGIELSNYVMKDFILDK
ncbi:radical SAM family heme chaperone HemW [Clostridium sp. YIM B02551]|uniref:radical SAM family heme chaperone HemW n=1 Tax=Clostridium sp. YIM B02551 TaxID=2910679 RepID=UPI001EECA1FD|nr:radical SAM family heme chaperone HemW [Clostridium sp. YIM B02551]